ncbi:MAG: MG2 domain-containing protein [Myxococcota bacterium]
MSERGSKGIPPARWAMAAIPVAVVFATMLACIGACTGFPCVTTGLRYGMWADQCPATDLRLDVRAAAQGLLRGHEGGYLSIEPRALWLDGPDRDAHPVAGTLSRGFSWTAALLDGDEQPVDGLVLERHRGAGVIPASLKADLPDGDYLLRVTVDAGFDQQTVDVPLPVYAPAIVHLMTDRPLYKPGQDVLLRSVALRRTDLTPLPERPGRWRITSPSGTEMLLERDQADAWGIADASFPLDAAAQIGTWTAEWITGGERRAASFEVRPFRLPRFAVEVEPSRPWYRIGDELVIEGVARYTSGAPIAGAPAVVSLAAMSGRWPLPLDWEEDHEVRTDAQGRFRASFGLVPPDLMDLVHATATVRVTEAGGEAVKGAADVVLSHRSLDVQSMTELGGGLVAGFNNRAYLRVTTPAGLPLANATVKVTRPYDPADPGKVATTDADGVAALQIDPGPPVTVVEPAPPVRVRPVEARPSSLSMAVDTATGSAVADLAAARAFDRLQPALDRCRPLAIGDQVVSLGVQLDGTGRVRRAVTGDDPLSACVADAVRGLSAPSGPPRTWELSFLIPDPQLPSLSFDTSDAFGSAPALPEQLAQAASSTRRCLAAGQGVDGAQVLTVHWAVERGSRSVATVVHDEPGHGLSAATVGCVRSELSRLALDEPAEADALGAATATLSVPKPPGTAVPQPTTRTAYELAVRATSGDEVLGEGRVVVGVGAVPPLRLRAEPTLAVAGDQVEVELIRGPGFQGSLPKELVLQKGTQTIARAEVRDKKAVFAVPDDVNGFLQVEWGYARAVVFVRSAAPLTVSVASDRSTYAPGDEAHLTVTTRAGDAPVPAAVGLVGLDATLAQLAPLVGPDDFGQVTVRATAPTPAFGTFDVQALALGQIRGENAAKAAVLAITDLPRDPGGDAPAAGAAQTEDDSNVVLARNFYRALDRARKLVRAWEADAADGALLQPEAMVGLWDRALAELRAEGDPAVDGYGRELTLRVLPVYLLSQTDPRALVRDGAHVPEDFVGWTQYVEQEVMR